MIRLILLFLFVISISAAAQDISITIQPVSVIECLGKPVNIFINAESKAGNNLKYQWYKDGEKVSEAVSPVLKFTSLQHNQSGLYYCRVTSEGTSETVNSISASVYALRPTSITKEPEDVLSGVNSDIITLEFDAHVNGFGIDDAIQNGEFVNIQWYRVIDNIKNKLNNYEIYDGVNSSKLSINTINLPDTTNYYAEIEGRCGISETRIAKVIKNLKLIELSIAGLDACEGNLESVKANISNPEKHKLEFQWYKNGKPIYYSENLKGIYSEELLFEPIYMQDSGTYKIEAKIKDINYKVFSNEVRVNVGKEPKIVCVRMDTLIALNTSILIKYRNINSSWLNIFYEKNNLPIRFDIFKNGELIAVRYSDSSLFSLGNISHLEYVFLEPLNINDIRPKEDSSSFWVIAYNDCGIAYSDTISLFNQTICDPFNQFYKLCVNEPFGIYLDYYPRVPIDELEIQWHDNQHYTSIFTTPNKGEYHTATKNKLELIDLRFFQERHNDETVSYYDLRYEVNRIIDSNTTMLNYNEFCCFYLRIAYLPTILRQPIEKKLLYGSIDTIFYINFDNEYGNAIEVELYYMASLKSKPRLIDKSVPEWGRWYNYIRNATFGEDGFYYAVTRYKTTSDFILCEPVITDTVKVTVIPKGIVAGVNENSIESYFSIQPNPASEFITIQIQPSEGFEPSESYQVQIIDVLGIEVMSESIHQMTQSHRMNIERLPAGVYYIRIGDRVEKFLKM